MSKLLEKEFDNYVKKFDMNIPQIRLKYYHSYEVMKLMNELADMLNLKEEEKKLASAIGLLHDIGRFPQIQEYGDCNDVKTGVDHAVLGINYLFSQNHIKDFYKKEEYYDFVKDAIDNHNKYKINDNISLKSISFSKMIRDMDKIDIYRVMAQEYESFFNKNEITPEVLEQFNNEKSILSKTKKTKTDNFFSCLGFIYDFNFKESFIILKKTNYLNLYFDSVKVDDNSIKEFNELKKKINKYVEYKIKD